MTALACYLRSAHGWEGRVKMSKLYLLAEIAGVEVAICSDVIESVVNVGEVIAVPRCDPVIAGLFALRSRVLTLVDCQYRITRSRKTVVKGSLAAIATIGGHSFGLLVDRVFDVTTVDDDAVHPAVKLAPEWAPIVGNLLAIDDRMVMMIDPDRLVAAEPAREAA
jgi:purine-binding chemotaxis protein CheW